MGLCQSEEEKKQVEVHRQIELRIQEAQDVEERTVKLLLLGKFFLQL
jgi:hypothetical protein